MQRALRRPSLLQSEAPLLTLLLDPCILLAFYLHDLLTEVLGFLTESWVTERSGLRLYLLNPKLELHPILTNSLKSFHLNFQLLSGRATGFNPEDRHRDLEFTAKNETATLPRVTELIIIARESPWCTVVKNQHGVTLGDICVQIWRDYAEHPLTEEEFASLSPATQDRVKRTALARETGGQRFANWAAADVPVGRCKRIGEYDITRPRSAAYSPTT
ncbi:hypothetical protein A7U60_g8498 [Sanghuangporus baumii]|uniref:DUF6699 domain-containing protein n=1 Tax=Sanghuangporus baumii TaxID=108892 RepID=A0A9Q5MYH0_SANBA|nr:hypothetical protein A7U60_g8498 [Sanghuangporus baumii]